MLPLAVQFLSTARMEDNPLTFFFVETIFMKYLLITNIQLWQLWNTLVHVARWIVQVSSSLLPSTFACVFIACPSFATHWVWSSFSCADVCVTWLCTHALEQVCIACSYSSSSRRTTGWSLCHRVRAPKQETAACRWAWIVEVVVLNKLTNMEVRPQCTFKRFK